MQKQLGAFLEEAKANFRDFLPILAAVVAFQWLIVGEPIPHLGARIAGIVVTLVGFALLVRFLDARMLPFGHRLTGGVARRGSLVLLIGFAFGIGFVSTMGQPALATVADRAASAAAAAGSLRDGAEAAARFSLILRYAVAAAVGIAVATGVLRIAKGWRAAWFVLPGYALATVVALSNDSPLAALAFDPTATTAAVNVPLIITLGTGLASILEARHPIADGFGLVAAASLMPIIVVQLATVALGG